MLQLLYQSLMTQLSTPPAAEQPGPQVFNSVHYTRGHCPAARQSMYQSRAHDLGEFKQSLLEIWNGLEQTAFDSTIDESKSAS